MSWKPRPVWSSDNSVEIANGWIQQGKDIPSLAAAINSTTYHGLDPSSTNTSAPANIVVKMDPTVLSATINAYNAACAAKADAQFGRSASTLVPIQTPPYYAMPLWPGGPSAFGGPVRNLMGQICDASNNPIPRLYSAGENGSVDGECALGANVAQLIAFGEISGTNAAALKAWS